MQAQCYPERDAGEMRGYGGIQMAAKECPGWGPYDVPEGGQVRTVEKMA